MGTDVVRMLQVGTVSVPTAVQNTTIVAPTRRSTVRSPHHSLTAASFMVAVAATSGLELANAVTAAASTTIAVTTTRLNVYPQQRHLKRIITLAMSISMKKSSPPHDLYELSRGTTQYGISPND